MKARLIAVATLLLIGVPLTAQETSLTLFSSGRVLVRRTLPVSLPAGTTTLPLTLGAMSPSEFAVLEPGVTLQRLAFDPAYSEEALLRRNLGQRFMIRRGTEQPFPATLVSLDPERWELPGTGILFGRPGQVIWPAEKVPSGPSVDVTLKSDRAREGLKLMYATSGANWSAHYRLTLGVAGRMEGAAMINTGALNFSDAEVQLLAGDIGAPQSMPPSRQAYAMSAKVASEDMNGAGTSEEAVGEARLYTLPGRVTFTPGTQLVMPLFDPAPAKAERRFTVSGALPYWGGFGQVEDEQDVPVAVAYRLERKLATLFGDVPLPGGSVQVFDTDKAGRLQLIGQGSIGHTAPGAELLVHTGNAFDVTARRTQTDFSVTRTTTSPTRTIAMVTFKVALQNAKDSSVVVDVREDRGGEWSIVESSVAAQKRSATRVVFPVTVPAKGKATLTYRVRIVW